MGSRHMFFFVVFTITVLAMAFFRRRQRDQNVFFFNQTIKQSSHRLDFAPKSLPDRRPLVLIAGVAVAAVVALGYLTGPEHALENPVAAGQSTPVVTLPAGSPTITATAPAVAPPAVTPSAPQPQPPRPQLAIVRLQVPSLAIDAPIVTLGVDPNGVMQSPAGPTEVGWYNFSSRPGFGGNVVLSGHLDFLNYGPAVFWSLRDATPGDIVRIVLEDGSTATYTIADVKHYEEDTAPVQAIVGPTDVETVTLITCAGSFDPSSREYNQRLVVTAVAEASATAAN